MCSLTRSVSTRRAGRLTTRWLTLALILTLRAMGAVPDPFGYLCYPAIDNPQLSPDGTMVAFVTSDGRTRSLAVYHADTGKPEILFELPRRGYSYYWKGQRILAVLDLGQRIVVESVLPGAKSLTPFPGYGTGRKIGGLVNWLPGDPNHILVTTKGWGRMDITTGEIDPTDAFEPAQFSGGYTVDNAGRLRLRFVQNRDGVDLEHRARDSAPFVPVFHWNWQQLAAAEDYDFGFGANPNVAYFLTFNEGNWGEVRPFDLKQKTFGPALAKGDGAELTGVQYAPDHSRIIGVHADLADGEGTVWLDPAVRSMQVGLDAALPHHRNAIVDLSADMKTALVISTARSEPGEYFLLDQRKGSVMRLGRLRPQLEYAALAEEKAVEITARDGLKIHAVLTVPNESHGPYSLIVMPRETVFRGRSGTFFGGYVQYLVSLGYAVLNVDFRGSGGYGLEYRNAGRHQFARKMPQDVEDATRWCLDNHLTVPGRVGVFGHNAGATQALLVATQSPDLYAVVVNWGGAPDFSTLEFEDNTSWMTRKRIELYFSDDADFLKAKAPINALGALRAPVLNVYDNPDRNEVWIKFRSALSAAGKNFDVVEPPPSKDAATPPDRWAYYLSQMATFLLSHLPPASPGP